MEKNVFLIVLAIKLSETLIMFSGGGDIQVFTNYKISFFSIQKEDL